MAAIVIGIYTRQAGVWQRCNGGTPGGFSGPQVNAGGTWFNCDDVHYYAGAWQYVWRNINGEIGPGFYSASDSSVGSPWSVDCWISPQIDGSVDRKHNQSTQTNWSSWRLYDCGRSYQWYFSRAGGATYVIDEPPLLVWNAPHNNGRCWISNSGTGFFGTTKTWTFYVRNTPYTATQEVGTIQLQLDAEGNQ